MRLLAIAAALGSMVGAAAAQDYPTRPINVIVPAAAGGPTDAISRITAQAMSKILGQQITIENAGGAGGTIGTGRAVRCATGTASGNFCSMRARRAAATGTG